MNSKNWGFLILGAAIVNTFVTAVLLIGTKLLATTNPESILSRFESLGNQGIYTTIIGFIMAIYLIKRKVQQPK